MPRRCRALRPVLPLRRSRRGFPRPEVPPPVPGLPAAPAACLPAGIFSRCRREAVARPGGGCENCPAVAALCGLFCPLRRSGGDFPARKSLRLFPAFLRLLWPVSRRDLPPVAAGKLSPVLVEEQENRLFFVRKAGITSCYSIFITRVRLTAPFFFFFFFFCAVLRRIRRKTAYFQ